MNVLQQRRTAGMYLSLCSILAFAMGISTAQADTNFNHHLARNASDAIGPLLVLGETSLLVSGKNGKDEARQGAKALIVTGLATEFLKATVRERRPRTNARTSFPSGHSSAAFAMATVIAEYHPKYEVPAYGVAGLVAWSRVELHAHYVQDVLAGALLGHLIAKREVRDHLALNPKGIALAFRW